MDCFIGKGKKPRPPIKWAGGKGQLLTQFEGLFPKRSISQYAEPFVGGGSVYFHLTPPSAVLIDTNEELVNFYNVVRNNLEPLLEALQLHRNGPDYYYAVRALDPSELTQIERASRFLYLNKTGYNGLWRVNRMGQHNVPFGRYKNPKICDEENLRAVHQALQQATILAGDFSEVLDVARPGMFVYLDPPYNPLSPTANFTSYTKENFGEADQLRLANVYKKLDRLGCVIMLSNSDTALIRELYDGYDLRPVTARRAINCRPDRRGPVTELVIRNFDIQSERGTVRG